MRKAAIRHGDPTTTGGFVMVFSSSIYDHGTKVALNGDEATCGNCKGTFKILGTGKGMSEKGRVVVVDGDLVLCPCKKNRVVIGSNPGIFLETSGGAAVASSVTSSTQKDESNYDEEVRAIAPVAMLRGYPYAIETADGEVVSGRLDNGGRLPRVFTDASEDYTVYWGDEALAMTDGV
ncbi:PAAR domain-containing protein [Paraburkholderia acidicola]|uniref:PAAR domain-containing protein n=1 Tax=Paraburkholderia acidicola TaxID=1912599 RepID=A0ABV1LKT3_9BURK